MENPEWRQKTAATAAMAIHAWRVNGRCIIAIQCTVSPLAWKGKTGADVEAMVHRMRGRRSLARCLAQRLGVDILAELLQRTVRGNTCLPGPTGSRTGICNEVCTEAR